LLIPENKNDAKRRGSVSTFNKNPQKKMIPPPTYDPPPPEPGIEFKDYLRINSSAGSKFNTTAKATLAAAE
jgi:hypothetical protein